MSGIDQNKVDSTLRILKSMLEKLQSEPKRHYKEPWSDWPDGHTVTGTPHACVYCLWRGKDDSEPVYVGETVDLGKRLSDHDKAQGWTPPKWEYVSFLADESLDDGQFRQLFECFCIELFKPIDNAERSSRNCK